MRPRTEIALPLAAFIELALIRLETGSWAPGVVNKNPGIELSTVPVACRDGPVVEPMVAQ